MFYEEPVFFEKNRVRRVYTGGKLFASFFGDDSEDGFYPEEWVVSSVHALNEGSTDEYEGISKIRGTDIYLTEALEKYKKEILGDKDEIGILTKFLDSAIRLPVQAHPDKEFSKKYFNSTHGKEESWLILGTRPGAKVYYGFKDGVTLEQFSAAVDASENGGDVFGDMLESIEVIPGDVIYIPAKFVHAIGVGCLLLEVQEPTDFTIQPERWCGEYKLSDKEMYLGLTKEQALECFDMTKKYPAPLSTKLISETEGCYYESAIDSEITTSFSVNIAYVYGGTFTLTKSAGIYVCVDGNGKIIGKDYEKEIKRGDYFLLPDSAAGKYSVTGKIKLAECFA